MVYPPTIPPNTRTNATVTDANHPDDHNEVSDALTSIVTELGSDPAGASVDVTARLSALDTTVAAKVAKSLYDANTILKADSDDTPVALTVAEQTLVGRVTAGSIDDLSVSAVRTMLDVPTNSEAILKTIIDAKGDLIVGTAADTPARLAVGTNGEVLLAASGETPGVDWTTTFTAAMTFSSVTAFAAGAAATPSLTFTGDTNTGIYSDTADTIQFSTGGTLRATINSTGVTVVGSLVTGSTGIVGQVYTSQAATGTDAAGYGNLGDTVTTLGYRAGKSNTSAGDYLTAVGSEAGKENAAASVTTIGYNSGILNSGANGTFVGAEAGAITSGADNTFIGHQSGYIQTGQSCAFLGRQTGYTQDGDFVTAFGTTSAFDNSGDSCVMLGYSTGYGNTYSSVILIGASAVAAAANEMVIGSGSNPAYRWIPGHDPNTYMAWAGDDTISFVTGGTTRVKFDAAGITMSDAHNIVLNATTGTKIGTATTQKLGFYNATPIVQGSAVADATGAGDVVAQLNALLARIRATGLIAT